MVPSSRGRGAYRALLQAPLEDARLQGAALALVHARAGTPGPILRRIGFTLAGQQTVLALPLVAPTDRRKAIRAPAQLDDFS